MKKFIPHPVTILMLSFWLPMYFLTGSLGRKAVILFLIISSFSVTGCYKNFYKNNTKSNASDPVAVNALKNPNKYFILHFKDAERALKNISVSENIIEGDVTKIDSTHRLYSSSLPANSTKSYKKKYEVTLLQEVHIYVTENYLPENREHIRLPISSVNRVDIYTKNKGATTLNHIISTTGVAFGVGFIVLFIAFLITCNCPQVYTYEAGEYQFKSGVFSGAIYSSMERTDYLPLKGLADENGKFLFRLMNNQPEEQFINQVQLAAVSHPAGEDVLLDRYGAPHSYSEPVSPVAVDNAGDDVTEALLYPDANTFIFDTPTSTVGTYSNTILEFKKPHGAGSAKLIVHAKNTMWSGYVYEQFSSLFGKQYQKWQAKQDNANGKELEGWMKDQSLPLMIYIETKEGWKFADYFPMTGNTAGRDMIMQIKLPEDVTDNIRIKIESAFMFWELDYAAIDFSRDSNFEITYLEPSLTNSTSTGISRDGILKKDASYAKLMQDDYLEMAFSKPDASRDKKTDYFLISGGYYHRITPYKGNAKLSQLNKFRGKGSFDAFSRMKFEEASMILAKSIK